MEVNGMQFLSSFLIFMSIMGMIWLFGGLALSGFRALACWIMKIDRPTSHRHRRGRARTVR